MKNQLLVLLSLLLMAFNINGQTLDLPLITIDESQVAYAAVDEIHFTLSIQTYSKEIADARKKNRQISETVFKYLKDQKIPKQFIQTKRMRISRNYTRNKIPKSYDGFYAYQNVYVCLKNIQIYDEIVDSLLQMDVSDINGPTFKSSAYETTLKKARIKALAKARKSAEEMAHALGQKIGKAKIIKTTVSRPTNSSYSSNNSSNTKSSQAGFEVGELEITATVQVSFELLD